MKRHLFIGSFLSGTNGTKDMVEVLKLNLESINIHLKLVSNINNRALRLIDILLSILIFNNKKIFFNVFSGKSFRITQWGSFLAKIRNKVVIYTLHGGGLHEFTDKNTNLVKKVFDRADYIQTPSLFLKAYFEKLGFKIHYLPNPINLDNFKYKRDDIIPLSILWVRAFTPIYNPALAVDILYETQKTYPHATLTMIGPDNGFLKQIQIQISTLGLTDSVIILGPVDNNDLKKYYQSHHVYINTTSYESFGMAIVEAAACGIPIVSTSVGEVPYLWTNEKNMLLINSFDAKDFSDAICKLFANENLAKFLSANARQNIQQFGWENIKPSWIKLLNNDF